jgi:multidrug resistance protein
VCRLFLIPVDVLTNYQIVYIVSIIIAMVGALVAALSKSIGVLIGMRCFQGLGSSAVLAIGAATLADIYDPHERGTKMGIYYAAPVLGPSIGPILGGILTQYLSWRATFWFLFIWMGICLAMFVFLFKDTYRRERSLTYQAVLRRHALARQRALAASSKRSSMATVVEPTRPLHVHRPISEKTEGDAEACVAAVVPLPVEEVKMTIRDVNPIPPLWMILRRWNNVLILTSSGKLPCLLTALFGRSHLHRNRFDLRIQLQSELHLCSHARGPLRL